MVVVCFLFQAEDGIRDLVRSRGLGDVYKRQPTRARWVRPWWVNCISSTTRAMNFPEVKLARSTSCLLYTSDAADERSSVDLGGRRIIKKKKTSTIGGSTLY